jgi:methyl-accepting chemotaxis protein
LLLALQAWIAISGAQTINGSAEDIATNWLPSVRSLGEMKALVTEVRLNNARILLTSDSEQRKQIEAQIESLEKGLATEIKDYEKLISSPEERKLWDSFVDKWNVYDKVRQQIGALAVSGDIAKATEAINKTGAEAFRNALKALDAGIDHNNKGAAEAVVHARQSYSSAQNTLYVVAGAAVVIGALAILFVIFRIASPLQSMNGTMRTIADGQLDTEVTFLARTDEIGDMAKALEVFKQNGLRVREMEAAQKRAEQDAAARRKADMIKLADDFEGAVGEIIDTVSAASHELEASAATLSSTAQRSQEITMTVSAASEEASTNVQSVASATEELSSSINEISRQVQDSARIATHAVEQASSTNARVSELSKAAARIGDVVELINTIAGQTNLLALNATIEAARAGEAGRGFAVVASEVKALAEQTGKATGEISQQITGIQAATQDSVSAIADISSTIAKLSEIASAIAAAVEEQGAATQEISRNIQQAAMGTQEVSASVIDVQHGAAETGSASTQVLSSAKSLADDSARLKSQVNQFMATVRAA